MNTEVHFGWELYTTSASPEGRSILHRSASLPTTYAWPVSSMEEESDSFLDLLRLQAGLLWDTVPNDLKKEREYMEKIQPEESTFFTEQGAEKEAECKKKVCL